MALRILFIIIGFVLVVNLVLVSVGLLTNVNLYEKYGKQILNFFIIFILLIVAIYITFAILGLID